MSKRARLVVIVLVACIGVLVVACSAIGYLGYRAASLDDGTLAEGWWPFSEEDTGPSPEGGVLRLFGGVPPTLDPAMTQDSTSAEYVVHLFSGLVTLDGELEVIPDLATRWDVTENGRVYTFHLLPEATFQDGQAITAQDFVYSMERACSPKLGSPVALAYLGDIVGAKEFSSRAADSIAGLRALSEHLLEIEIDLPKAYFLAKLSYPCAFVVDRAQIEKQGGSWLSRPNGSGPFVLDSVSGERIVLRRNERYYGERPALQRVEFILSGGLPITMYENDQLDIVQVAPSEIERVLDPGNPLHGEHVRASELSVQYLGLNVSVRPFDDIAVRRAFAHAIDRHKIADLVLKGTATPAEGILPPAMPDYDEDLEGLPYDPGRARQLLAGSRYGAQGAMPRIVLTVSGTSGYMSSTTRAILGMIEENLGLEMAVEQVEWGDFLQDLNQGSYQMFSAGWIADYPDSQNFLDILFHSSSSQNYTSYRNAQVDSLLERARVETDVTRRTALYREAERIIVAQVAWIPLTHGTTHALIKPYVKGFGASGGLYPWLKDIYLEE